MLVAVLVVLPGAAVVAAEGCVVVVVDELGVLDKVVAVVAYAVCTPAAPSALTRNTTQLASRPPPCPLRSTLRL